MRKLYSHFYVYFAVVIIINFVFGQQLAFAKNNKDFTSPIEHIKPRPFEVKPVPFYLKTFPIGKNFSKSEFYHFDMPQQHFDKIVERTPILTEKEWTYANGGDPIKFTLTPNKTNAKLGEDIELTLTAELMNVSPQMLFTFDELRNYTLKVVLPQDFIQTDGTYYDFVTGTLDANNPKQQYTIKGKYLDKPALDDCFKVLRKVNNEVFILKNTTCIDVKDIDLVAATPEKVNSGREVLTGINATKIKIFATIVDKNNKEIAYFNENSGTFNINCFSESPFFLSFSLKDSSILEIRNNNGYVKYEILRDNIVSGYSTQNGDGIGGTYGTTINSNAILYTCKLSVYSNSNTGGDGFIIKTINVTVNSSNCPPNITNSLSITAEKTTICPNTSTTLTATGTCPAANINWFNGSANVGSGTSISVTTSGAYSAVCSSPALTSNTINIVSSNWPGVPNISTNRHTITPGEFFVLSANNCQGTVVWYGPNNFTDFGNEISSNKPGNYQALCRSNCSENVYVSALSSIVSITLLPLRLEANKYEKYSNETAQVSAYGCANGFISWKVNGVAIKTSDNPLTAYDYGVYSAQCTSYNGPSSEWVSLYISLKNANTPRVTANKSQAFPSDDVVLTASGCPAGWYYAWQIPVHDPVTNAVNVQRWVGNPQTVKGPETYKVQCVLAGNPDGPFESITISALSIYDIVLNITPNKTEANPGEVVIFTATGNCPNGAGIRWFINGMNYWTWVGETFQATGPGTYSARCESGYAIGKTVYSTINTPRPGAVTIIADKPRVKDNELVTLRAVGCDKEVNWTLPNGNEVVGTSVLFNFGPGVYKAKCIRFGFSSEPASITIAPRNWNEPVIAETNASISANQLAELSISGCPNNWVGWRIPVKDANGNIVYQISSSKTQLIRDPGIYYYHCAIGDYTAYVPIEIHPAAPNSLTIKPSITSARPDETVTLTAYGCPNGVVNWQLGTATATGVRITVVGPGLRTAKCVGDYNNNGDLAMVNIRSLGDITPFLTATSTSTGLPISEACPTEPVTITASGCPNGWWYQTQFVKPNMLDYWLTHRQGVDDLGIGFLDVFGFAGGTVPTQGPNIYFARCISPDGGWMGDFRDKYVVIDPAFPADLRVSNNGPALTGATSVRLAVTDVPNVSYAWAGPNSFASNLRNPEILTPTEAKSGIYTVTLNRGGSQSWACNTTATTKVAISGCDIRIKASDPTTGVETYTLPYSATPTRDFGDLGLEVISPSGMPLSNMTFLWTKPDGTTSSDQQLVIDKKGIYSVRVNVVGTTIGCRATVSVTEPQFKSFDWSKTKRVSLSGGRVMSMTPINYNGYYTFVYHKANGVDEEINIGYDSDLSKLLMYDTPSGERKYEVLHIIPRKDYFQTNSSISATNFNGFVLHYDFTGKTLISGLQFGNGNIVKTITPSNLPNQRPSDFCRVDVYQTAFKEIERKETFYLLGGGTGCDGTVVTTSMGNACMKTTSTYGNVKELVDSYTIPCSLDGDPPITLPPSFDPVLRDNSLDVLINGGGNLGTIPLPTYQKQMCGFVEQMLVETDKVEPQVIISNNNDAGSAQRFTLYVQLLYDAMKKELQKDPTLAHYASTIQFPTANSQLVIQAAKEFGNGTSNGTLNYSSAACKLTSLFLNDNPTQTKADEEKLNNVFSTVVEKAKNSYSALAPILNTCTEVVSTSNTSGVYCTAQANWAKEIAQIIQDSNLPISETIQWSNDGTPVIAGIKGVDLWSKILTLHPTIPVENIPPLKQRIVIGNLEIIYTRFSTSTDDGKITYKITENNASSNLDLYFLDDDSDDVSIISLNKNSHSNNVPPNFTPMSSFDWLDIGRLCGVEEKVRNKYPNPDQAQTRNFKYTAIMGLIFQDLVLKSMGRSENTNTSFPSGNPKNNPANVKPDAFAQGGADGVKLVNGVEKHILYVWNNATFIDAKTTFNRNDQVIHLKGNNPKNEDQLQGFINFLKSVNDGYYREIQSYEFVDAIYDSWVDNTSIGATPIKKNAAESGGASIHIITPDGVTLDNELKTACGLANINLYQSTVMYDWNTKQLYVKQAELVNKTLLKKSAKTTNRILYGGQNITLDCNVIKDSPRLKELN